MSYEVRFWKPAEKFYIKLNKSQQEIFNRLIDKLKEDPKFYGKPLHVPLQGKWTYRFEKKFRIVFTIDEKNKVIEIEAIKHKDEF